MRLCYADGITVDSRRDFANFVPTVHIRHSGSYSGSWRSRLISNVGPTGYKSWVQIKLSPVRLSYTKNSLYLSSSQRQSDSFYLFTWRLSGRSCKTFATSILAKCEGEQQIYVIFCWRVFSAWGLQVVSTCCISRFTCHSHRSLRLFRIISAFLLPLTTTHGRKETRCQHLTRSNKNFLCCHQSVFLIFPLHTRSFRFNHLSLFCYRLFLCRWMVSNFLLPFTYQFSCLYKGMVRFGSSH